MSELIHSVNFRLQRGERMIAVGVSDSGCFD